MPLKLLLLACLLSICACATNLPDVSELADRTVTKSVPTIVTPHGTLPDGKARDALSRIERQGGGGDLLGQTISLMESLSHHPLTAGNRVALLIDGPATYAAMIKKISEARDHVNFETFTFSDDEVGRQFADLLLQKRAEGVQVNLLYDAVGSMYTPAAFFKRMKDAGINVVEYNPINPFKVKKKFLVTRRDHRKVIVVDGKVAFTGGVNVSNVYTSSPSAGSAQKKGQAGWRDTHVQIEGPAVAQLQRLFLEVWEDQSRNPPPPANYFPPLRAEGNVFVEVIGSSPAHENPLTYVMYMSAIKHATRSIHLTTAYFVPDHQLVEALNDAAKRGVDVKIILSNTSDSTLALYAARSHYSDLLESGASLYERRERMVHAKTAIVDGIWSTVGSTNLDQWSFRRNNEANAIILGSDFAGQLEALFGRDMAQSNRITPEEWFHRSLLTRVKELVARLLSPWL